MKNVMVDLETLGNGSNSVIVSIGAVEFGPEGLGREFYTLVNPESCIKVGLQMDASTVMWWMDQSDEARAALSDSGAKPLGNALLDFFEWYPQGAGLWGNGATFDNVILSNAYRVSSLAKPWTYSADRCYRTLKSLHPEIKGVALPGEIAHNALADAKYQARHAVELLNTLGVAWL